MALSSGRIAAKGAWADSIQASAEFLDSRVTEAGHGHNNPAAPFDYCFDFNPRDYDPRAESVDVIAYRTDL